MFAYKTADLFPSQKIRHHQKLSECSQNGPQKLSCLFKQQAYSGKDIKESSVLKIELISSIQSCAVVILLRRPQNQVNRLNGVKLADVHAFLINSSIRYVKTSDQDVWVSDHASLTGTLFSMACTGGNRHTAPLSQTRPCPLPQ